MSRMLVYQGSDQAQEFLLFRTLSAAQEVAEICGVAVGTIKSRVNRARIRLAELLSMTGDPDLGADSITKAALGRLSLGSPA